MGACGCSFQPSMTRVTMLVRFSRATLPGGVLNKSAASSGKIGTAASFMLLQMGRTRLVQRTGCGGRLGGSRAMIFHRSPACMFCGPFFLPG